MSTPKANPERQSDPEALYQNAADKLGSLANPYEEAMAREPWPEWQSKMAKRMARTFSPHLKAEDLKDQRHKFDGYVAASEFALTKCQEGLNFSAIPEAEFLAAIRKQHNGKGILELVAEAELFEQMKQSREHALNVELPQLYETISAAARLPLKEAAEFFEAFGDGLKRQMGLHSVQRLGDSPTVQICLFTISCRPLIEDTVFQTITELIDFYFYLRDKEGEKISQNALAQRIAFARQFRRICTEDGLKLAGRGKPRKALATPPPIERPKRPRSRKL